MEMTVTLKGVGLFLIIAGLVILIVFSIILIKNLIGTLKHTNKILTDVEVISGIAANRIEDVDKIVGDVSESVENVSDILKGNQSVIKAISTIIVAAGSLKNLIKKKD